jgi:hypothetical protein
VRYEGRAIEHYETCKRAAVAAGGDDTGTHLAIILPGNATLTVQSLPVVGLKMAVGFEVSIEVLDADCPLGLSSTKSLRFRFCRISAWTYDQKSARVDLRTCTAAPHICMGCVVDL